MKNNALSVYGVNATVVADVTPTGRRKYVIELSQDAGTAVDRIQICHDFDHRLPLSYRLIENTRVFFCENDYITFAMYPRNRDSNYIITCRCNQSELEQSKALELIEAGMSKAVSTLNS